MSVVVVVIVGTKITSSWDLHICVWCNYNKSRNIYEKLPSLLFKLHGLQALQIVHFPFSMPAVYWPTHSAGWLVWCSYAVSQTSLARGVCALGALSSFCLLFSDLISRVMSYFLSALHFLQWCLISWFSELFLMCLRQTLNHDWYKIYYSVYIYIQG